MDLAFARRTEAAKAVPFIVARDAKTRLTFAHLLQGKSTTTEAYSEYVVASIGVDRSENGQPAKIGDHSGSPRRAPAATGAYKTLGM